MNKTVEESSLKELNNFPSLMKSIMEYLDKYWKIKAKPKGYDKYLETYEEYDTEDREYEFSGPLDVSASCDEFPERISRSNVAYGDTQQGRTPVYELIGAVFAYGLNIGAQRQKINTEDMYALENIKNILEDVASGRDIEELKERAERGIKSLERNYPIITKK